MGKIVVQIGTNDGDDEFNKMVKVEPPFLAILVEPNKSLNDKIEKNYGDTPNVFIENVAIANVGGSMVKLVIPRGGKDKNGTEYNDKNYSLLPLDDWGDDFDYILAPSMTFMELCYKYDIRHIDYLQIDTEGYDAEIIKSIDFDKVDIDIIKYEDWSFSENCFTRYGENAKLYGVNGMQVVASKLISLGYQLEHEGGDITAIKNGK